MSEGKETIFSTEAQLQFGHGFVEDDFAEGSAFGNCWPRAETILIVHAHNEGAKRRFCAPGNNVSASLLPRPPVLHHFIVCSFRRRIQSRAGARSRWEGRQILQLFCL